MNTDCVLTLKNLSLSYYGQTVLKNTSLCARRGVFYALLGLNGSGKSSLFKAITKNIFYQGTIYVENQDIQNLSTRKLAQKVALLAQQNTVFAPLTVWEIVLMGRYPYRPVFWHYSAEDTEICQQALYRTQTDTLKHRKIRELSGGEAQRVWLAQKLAQNTPILLLDEPTQHLDIKQKKLFYHLLQNIIQNERKTIIMSTHDLNEIKQVSGTIWYIYQKNIHVIENYTAEDVDKVKEKLLS
ncbi:MAG: ABC transporter ATP-binding protein [Bacteroidia bacterium]|nr:ABC transporter ATP-binding protein [Bacteroidia bacterium]